MSKKSFLFRISLKKDYIYFIFLNSRQMKRFIILLVLFPFLGQAQTIQGTAFPAIGSIYTLTLADSTGIQPGNSGTGITWDFSTLVNTG